MSAPMTLARQSRLLASIAAVVVAIVCATSALAVRDIRTQTAQIEMAEFTVRAVTHCRYLIMEAAMFGQARSSSQWQLRIASFRQGLREHRYGEPGEEALLARERDSLEVLARSYDRLTGAAASRPMAGNADPVALERTAALTGALFLTTQDMIDDGFELMRRNRADLERAQQRALVIILGNVVVLALLVAGSCVIIRRHVLRPVRALQDVAARVARGDLSLRLRLDERNELGQLANRFDYMTGQLAAGQAAMEAEIAERRIVQRSLQHSNDALAARTVELARSQAQRQNIIDHSPALVAYWDADGLNQFANLAHHGWYGVAPERLRGQPLAHVMGEDNYAAIAPYIEQVLGGAEAVFEQVHLLPDKTARACLFSCFPDLQDGQVTGFFSFISDISELKKAEAVSARSLSQLQGVLDAATDFAIIATALDGCITLFSKGAEQLLGYRAEELVGKASPDRFHCAEEIEARRAALARQLGGAPSPFEAIVHGARSAASDSAEWRYVRRDGQQVPVSLTVTALRQPDGALSGFLGIAKDIRQDKAVIDELATARDDAQSANRSKTEFLANMSHEIRTPMNAVLGMLQLLKYTALSPVQADYVGKTQSAAEALMELLNEILDLSKVEAGKMTLENAPFCIDAFMRELAVLTAPLVGAKDVELLFALDPQLPPVVAGDALRIRQVMLNLVGNAIKFTTHGEVQIAVRAGGGERRIEFSVRDTGIGMDETLLPQIFTAFSQGDSGTTRRFGGTGLGLTISRRLVELMGGQLHASSAPGEGSRFWFSVELPPVAAAPALAAADGPPLRTLIVDDSESARDALLPMVAALGWQGVAVAGGAEALALLATVGPGYFDLVLVDWRMTGMDGWELARSIRAREREEGGRMAIVIMVTAYGRNALVAQLQQHDCPIDHFLLKPVMASTLRSAVAEAARQEQQPGGPQSVPGSRLEGRSLLVVDDNALNQEVACVLLRLEGATVDVAASGRQALELILARNRLYDAVLMDVQMPDMDGYEATRILRLDARMRTLPIIAMTANVMAGDREICLAAGMTDYVMKPIERDRLVTTLMLYVAGGAAVDAGRGGANDTRSALARMGGNQALFLSLAERFGADAAVLVRQVHQYLQQQRDADAAGACHALRGMAATVGAGALASLSERLERELRGGSGRLDRVCLGNELGRELDCAIAMLDLAAAALRGHEHLALPGQPIEQAGVQALLARLEPHLRSSNMRAVTLCASLMHAYGPLLGRTGEALASSVGRLAFSEALAHLGRLQHELTR